MKALIILLIAASTSLAYAEVSCELEVKGSDRNTTYLKMVNEKTGSITSSEIQTSDISVRVITSTPEEDAVVWIEYPKLEILFSTRTVFQNGRILPVNSRDSDHMYIVSCDFHQTEN